MNKLLIILLLSTANYSYATLTTNVITNTALSWQDKGYRMGKAEQCMNWTREVLVSACGDHFKTLQTHTPWDAHLLGEGDKLAAIHADSLASDEFGQKITLLSKVQQGDLLFFKNTYGNWADGVITHVGIALDNSRYIHRMTSNKGIVRVEPIPKHEFASALRLNKELCRP
ncbi:NlpC/P60 family protein [Pseudoalteromonas haloplanktis]|uniref:NlpC/P60 family protein n=1 Tax=Pseudoalteromonas haloplanktis TaxID=228 RepID=A0ABU1B7I9_PSEHA|nr:NlpC/P60 family protein [Pseudoalteromonas haloplanktis]MDQ9090212.1 NlpC/P60 family protein [Pseudoalteromonas haloplanktis]